MREPRRHDRDRGGASRCDGPRRALVGAGVDAEEEEAEPESGDEGESDSGCESGSPRGIGGLSRERDDAGDDERDADPLHRSRNTAVGRVGGERHDRRGGGDRRHDAHGADREAAVESRETDDRRDAGRRSRQQLPDTGERISGGEHPERDAEKSDGLRDQENSENRKPTGGDASQEVADAPAERAGQRQQCRHATSVVADWASGRLAVELVRVIEDRGLRRARSRAVVMARDRMEELGEDGGIEVRRAFLDHAQA